MSVGNSKTDRQGFSVVSRGWGGGGGSVLPYMGYISCCKGYGFQAVYSGIGYITLAEDFGLD